MAGLIAVQLRNKRAKEAAARLETVESEGEEDRLSLPPNYFRQPKYVRPASFEVIWDLSGTDEAENFFHDCKSSVFLRNRFG